jgi:predicted PurR-regulated permease PerM
LSFLFFNVVNAASFSVKLNNLNQNIPIDTVKTIRTIDELVNNLDSTVSVLPTADSSSDKILDIVIDKLIAALESVRHFHPKLIYLCVAFVISIFLLIFECVIMHRIKHSFINLSTNICTDFLIPE